MTASTSAFTFISAAALFWSLPVPVDLQGTVRRDSMQGSSVAPYPADNTGLNRRDTEEGEVTAEDQGESPADLDITRKVRRAILEDDSLSTYAHNVKVITQEGVVTLKGPVQSLREKSSVEGKAVAVVGAPNVKNELQVITPQERK